MTLIEQTMEKIIKNVSHYADGEYEEGTVGYDFLEMEKKAVTALLTQYTEEVKKDDDWCANYHEIHTHSIGGNHWIGVLHIETDPEKFRYKNCPQCNTRWGLSHGEKEGDE